ncbi:sterol-4-alpha-carboxylate 3-dehydrogenase, decarboxylating [Fusarium flagelliforme]|uniref:Sterol-4-alpha-carboxylate 3-dehydrogenase, decarboxylating n=1 Tax=Fusarium flagelliforme TaxID=2675880 RepID=A0A395MX17_9HYPO|nr:sterol-4-alpha-carboxylate 3-dehydrogenase, decarboxylating [Fusarium flagelliforme]
MSSKTCIEAALVVGGCGFLGYHLVQYLLEDNDPGILVAVLDRNVTKNTHEGVKYVQGDITNADLICQIINEMKPSIIFHCASPIAALPAWRESEFYETNVKGTEILLNLASESNSVRAFVFTSSIDVYANPPHINADETLPLWPESDRSNEYNRTKAIGDRIVRQANGSKLKTAVLRPGHAYGERQVQGMIEAVKMAAGNGQLIQIGNGKNMVEVIFARNFAIVHTLAAKALLDPSRTAGKVDGEAFNISDGRPVPFWHHVRIIWEAVRGKDVSEEIIVLPGWVMAVASFLAEWLFFIFSFGRAKPPVELRRMSVEYCLYDHTHSIQKARERLLFDPKSDHDTAVVGAVRWMLESKKGIMKKNE